MSADKHATNNQADIMKKYRYIVALKNLNEAADVLHIDYRRMDIVSAGKLKDGIAKTLSGFKDLDLPEETMKYVFIVTKQNMGSSVTIDFAKLDNEHCMTANLLKQTISKVLADRKNAVYNNMIRNTNW